MEATDNNDIKKDQIDILLVEDSYHDAEMVKWSLGQHVMMSQLLHLKSGIEALDYLFARGTYSGRDPRNRPSVIFLDLKMPKMDGIEVLKQIRANPLTSSLPVIILTSSKEKTDIEKCYDYRANSYIVKPVGFSELCKIVGDVGYYWVMINQKFENT